MILEDFYIEITPGYIKTKTATEYLAVKNDLDKANKKLVKAESDLDEANQKLVQAQIGGRTSHWQSTRRRKLSRRL